LKQKKAELLARIADLKSVLVAFSGGVDSTLLLKLCHDVLKDRAMAVTATSSLQPGHENEAAFQTAQNMGVRHIRIQSQILDQAVFLENTDQRCYHCKRHLFEKLRILADDLKLAHVAHGANADDLSDYRPGFRAAEELGVVAPLLEVGLGKSEIRQLSKQLNLATWDKPAMACLATRIPYGTTLTTELLDQVNAAEAVMAAYGFRSCRVRCHGPIARIEVPEPDIERFLEPALRKKLVEKLKDIGFKHVTVDLEGYVMGSMNLDLD
jgi:uncharacterized protein